MFQTLRMMVTRTSLLIAMCMSLSGHAIAQSTAAAPQFEQARILRAAGEYKPAIEILRGLVRANPRDAIFREELGYALLLDRQMAAAQYQFEILKERSTTPDARALYTAVLRRIVAERPVGVSLIFGFRPTSNLNQGTDNTTQNNSLFGVGQITEESRRISGWSGRIGLRGYIRGNLGAHGRVALDWRVQRHEYSSYFAPETEAELGLTFSKTMPNGDFGTRIFRAHRKRDQGDRDSTGVTLFGGYNLDQGRRIDGTLRFSDLKSKANSGQNGLRTLVDLGYALTPNPAFAVRFGIQAEHANTQRTALGYTSLAATAQASQAFRGGYEVTARLIAGQRHFNTDIGFAQKDSFANASVTVFNSRFSLGGVVPKLTCRIARNASNVALYDTTERACGVALSRRF